MVGHVSGGAACPSRETRGGDRIARRERQRALRDRSRDDRTLSRVLARALSPLQGGSVPRKAERPSKLQLLQQFAVAGYEDGKDIRSRKDQAIYVGITNPTNRSKENEKSGEKQMKIIKRDKKLLRVKNSRIKPLGALMMVCY